ncbi:MAG: hypothetical protein MZV65_49025 [Chromatiales bacterium]|nr:hypothetical protein [Chromatiales bacterium]
MDLRLAADRRSAVAAARGPACSSTAGRKACSATPPGSSSTTPPRDEASCRVLTILLLVFVALLLVGVPIGLAMLGSAMLHRDPASKAFPCRSSPSGSPRGCSRSRCWRFRCSPSPAR